MQISSLSHIKKELQTLSQEELIQLCLRLAKFKKENKELINYLLFLEKDKEDFIKEVKYDMDISFEDINRTNFHLIKKSIRKILRETRKQIRIAADKQIEIELLIYFCEKLNHFSPSIERNTVLSNLYNRLIDQIQKKISKLHEDLQFDYTQQLKEAIK